MPEAIGAQFELTVNAVGKVSAPGTPLFFNAKYVAPLEKKGIAVTFATPIRMALAPLAPTESTISLYVACNVATGVISVESPALAERVAGGGKDGVDRRRAAGLRKARVVERRAHLARHQGDIRLLLRRVVDSARLEPGGDTVPHRHVALEHRPALVLWDRGCDQIVVAAADGGKDQSGGER